MITHGAKKKGILSQGFLSLFLFAFFFFEVLFKEGPICAVDWYKASHFQTTTQILVSTVSWLGIFHLLYSLPDPLPTSGSFCSLTWCQTVPLTLSHTAWSNRHQREPLAVWMKKASRAQSSSRGTTLEMIAAALVTGPVVLWPDLSCVELLPLPSAVLSDFHSAPPGPTLG